MQSSRSSRAPHSRAPGETRSSFQLHQPRGSCSPGAEGAVGAAANCGSRAKASEGHQVEDPAATGLPATLAEAALHFFHLCASRPGPAGPLARTPVVKADGGAGELHPIPPPAVASEASSGAAGGIRDNAAFILSRKVKTRLSSGQHTPRIPTFDLLQNPGNRCPPLTCLGY